jgi:hypothetical protein
VGSFGKLPPNPSWQSPFVVAGGNLYWPYVVSLRQPVSSGSVPDGPVAGVLAIRVWMAPYVAFSYGDSGGLQATPLVGSQEAITGLATTTHFAWLEGNLYQIVTACVAGVVALLAWLRNPSRWMLVWLALYTAHPVLLFPLVSCG